MLTDKYCPRGSPQPLNVSEGFYSIAGETAEKAIDQKQCELYVTLVPLVSC